jgi:hypothetical protein
MRSFEVPEPVLLVSSAQIGSILFDESLEDPVDMGSDRVAVGLSIILSGRYNGNGQSKNSCEREMPESHFSPFRGNPKKTKTQGHDGLSLRSFCLFVAGPLKPAS